MSERYPAINVDRLWDDLRTLSGFGRGERGVTRLAFSPADMEARLWLVTRMREAGMSAHIDKAGNVIGDYIPSHLRALSDEIPAIILGSHTDTVPEGGMFDGALGVIGALEVVRTIAESGRMLAHPIRVISFSNEEGSRIMPGTFGSRYYTGKLGAEEWRRVAPFLKEAGLGESADLSTATPLGRTMREETFLDAASPEHAGAAGLCYLELHIEQGGVLDSAGEDIGVVTGIVWIASFTATFRGVANHAGTTPMAQRKDALLGAAELALAVPELVKLTGGPATVGTCGQMSVLPGGRNVIPGEVTMSIEVRDQDEALCHRVIWTIRDTAVRAASRRGLALDLSELSLNPGAPMDQRLQEVIAESASSLGLSWRRMPSGAGHDAMNMAGVLPTGMVFVPSLHGISHSPNEETAKEKCGAGVEVLIWAVLAVDGGALDFKS